MTIDCANCGGAVHAEVAGCPACGADPRTGVVPEHVLRMTALSHAARHDDVALLDQTRLEGIGGWLVLPLIGLCLSPFSIVNTLRFDVLPFFGSDQWSVLTTPGGEFSSAFWAPYLITTLVGNVGLLALIGVTLVLFLQRRRAVPLLMTVIFLVNIAFALFDLISWQYLASRFPALGDATPVQWLSLVRPVAVAAVWIPYFRLSVRVRNTFVR